MPPRDLAAELRAARVEAPPALRANVRLIAAGAAAPRRRLTFRRALVVALPAAAAVAAAVVLTRPGAEQRSTPVPETVQHGSVAGRAAPARTSGAATRLAVPSPRARVQRYDATLSLRLASPARVSDGIKRALRITHALGGYEASVQAATEGQNAHADLTLRIPRAHVQEALRRLSALGTIEAEQVSVQDEQARLSATDRTIARLQRELKALRAQTPRPEQRIAQLTARIAALQRSEAQTRRNAHYATVRLHLATPAPPAPRLVHHGPLHGVVVALRDAGIGAVYALALGGPVVLLGLLVWLGTRALRQRREDDLLSRS